MDLCEKLVAANLELLEQCRQFIEDVPLAVYTDASQPPFPFSIGAQVRHNLDMYTCFLRDFEEGPIDFTNRERENIYEVDPDSAIRLIERLQSDLERFSPQNVEKLLGIIIRHFQADFKATKPGRFEGHYFKSY